MSPEILNGQVNYDTSADIYSLAMVLWEICSLQRPFSDVAKKEKLFKHIISKQRRPSLRYILLPQLQKALSAAWDANPQLRPSAALLEQQLLLSANLDDA
jgi:serine/threonine protein kinase